MGFLHTHTFPELEFENHKILRSRPRCTWEDNIRMDFREMGVNAGNWVDSAQDRDLMESPCECGIEPTDSMPWSCIVLMGWSFVPNALRPFQDLL